MLALPSILCQDRCGVLGVLAAWRETIACRHGEKHHRLIHLSVALIEDGITRILNGREEKPHAKPQGRQEDQ
jgi:hypothetical protein